MKKEPEVSESLKAEEKVKSEWFILESNGKMHEIKLVNGKVSGFDFSKFENLRKFAQYEMAKSREAKEEPVHIKIMKKLELVDYEPGSDPGNFRFLPKGKLIKTLLEDLVSNEMIKNGAMEIESPIMYDSEHPALKKYLHRFPARQYIVESPNKRLFLRFSACFGQFLMAHDANISYKNLPLWVYELTRYSFRTEKRGELSGLRRLRAFTMPDCHAICADLNQAKEELGKRFDLSWEMQEKIGFKLPDDLEMGLRSVKSFWEENEKFLKNFAKKWKKPVLVELWDKHFAYFVAKYEFNFVDSVDKASALTTDQLDIENAENYDLTFRDKDNKLKRPLILHLSPSGAIERVMYSLLEDKAMKDKKRAILPIWLSPIQVRLCPVNDDLKEYCDKIADDIVRTNNIRVDIDDRAESIEKKVRDAEMDWVPYIVVIGDKEKNSGKLAVRFRESGKVENISKEELVKIINEKTKGMPFRMLPLHRLISKRPTFIG